MTGSFSADSLSSFGAASPTSATQSNEVTPEDCYKIFDVIDEGNQSQLQRLADNCSAGATKLWKPNDGFARDQTDSPLSYAIYKDRPDFAMIILKGKAARETAGCSNVNGLCEVVWGTNREGFSYSAYGQALDKKYFELAFAISDGNPQWIATETSNLFSSVIGDPAMLQKTLSYIATKMNDGALRALHPRGVDTYINLFKDEKMPYVVSWFSSLNDKAFLNSVTAQFSYGTAHPEGPFELGAYIIQKSPAIVKQMVDRKSLTPSQAKTFSFRAIDGMQGTMSRDNILYADDIDYPRIVQAYTMFFDQKLLSSSDANDLLEALRGNTNRFEDCSLNSCANYCDGTKECQDLYNVLKSHANGQ